MLSSLVGDPRRALYTAINPTRPVGDLVREQDSFHRLVIQCNGDLQQERITDKMGGKQQQKNTKQAKYGHYPHPGGVGGEDRKKVGENDSNHWPLVIPC